MEYEKALDCIAESILDAINDDIADSSKHAIEEIFSAFINNDPLVQYIVESNIATDLAKAVRCNKDLIEKIIKNNKMITPSKPA